MEFGANSNPKSSSWGEDCLRPSNEIIFSLAQLMWDLNTPSHAQDWTFGAWTIQVGGLTSGKPTIGMGVALIPWRSMLSSHLKAKLLHRAGLYLLNSFCSDTMIGNGPSPNSNPKAGSWGEYYRDHIKRPIFPPTTDVDFNTLVNWKSGIIVHAKSFSRPTYWVIPICRVGVFDRFCIKEDTQYPTSVPDMVGKFPPI